MDENTDYSQIAELNLIRKELNKLPDLTKYTNLKILKCSSNKINSLDNLPKLLKIFSCGFNNISSLNNLPESLTHFNCYNNPLIYEFVATIENIRAYNKSKGIQNN